MGVQPGKATNDPSAYIAIGKQAAKGTEATTFTFVKQKGAGLEVERQVQHEREGGDGQEIGLSYVSLVTADGEISGNARPDFTGRIFAAAIGQDTISSAAVPSLARHTTALTASMPYFTVDQRWSDEIERADDCVVTGFSLEGEAGRPWVLTTNFLSGGTVYQRDIASTLTPTRESGKPHFFPNGSYVFDGAASYGADVTKIKVEVVRSVDDAIQTTGLGRDDAVPLAFDVNIDATLKYTSRDFYQKVKYSGGSIVQSVLPTGSLQLTTTQLVNVGAANAVASGLMQVNCPLIEWSDAKVNKLEPDGKTVYIDVVGNSLKGATHPIWTIVDSTTLVAY